MPATVRPFPCTPPPDILLPVSLITLWVATLGADRIDLLGGMAPFALLPFHLLTALVIASEWRRRWRAGSRVSVTVSQGTFGVLVLALLALVAVSVLRSGDILLSTNRLILLAGTVIGSSLAIWGMADRKDLLPLLARGARLGLIAAVVFDVIQLFSFLRLLPEEVRIGPANIILLSHSYGIIPRLTALGFDMNGSGGTLLGQTVLIALAGPAVRYRRAWVVLGSVLLLATLSRSSILAAIPVLLLFPRVAPAGRGLRLGIAAGALLIAVASSVLLSDGVREAVGRALVPLAGRFDPEEGSAQVHARLITRGLAEATADVPRTLLGIGYGASHRILSDVFPGTKYGNFHSLYIQLWVECGIFPPLILLLVLALSVQRAGALRGLVLGFMVYNVFYQGLAQPVLWLTLAMVWFAASQLPVEGHAPSRPVERPV